MEKMQTLCCTKCKATFKRSAREVRRQIKNGVTNSYCSQSCQVAHANKLSPRGTATHLNPANKRDALTPFRWFVNRANARRLKHGRVEVTTEFLLELWEEQMGVCPLSGRHLVLPTSTQGWADGASAYNASLDRIDCTRGYVPGNVRFVSVMANIARGKFTDGELIAFCKDVAENN